MTFSSTGVLGDWLLQPAGLPDGDASGGDAHAQGLGARLRHLPEPGHALRQGGHPRLATGGGLHPRQDKQINKQTNRMRACN